MNFLTFVFSILLVLSFGTYAAIEKMAGDRRIRSTYLGHLKANRKILSKCESETYRHFRSVEKGAEEKTKKQSSPKPTPPTVPRINPECARLNLWPLVQEGRESHPFLYESTAKLLRLFYGSALFENKPRAEYAFLDQFLKKAKEHPTSLEKISLGTFQPLYYKMLKGTKEWNLEANLGYPSFLDAVSLEESPSKVCICHAHPDQLAVFFGPKAAAKLFAELHQKNPPPASKDLIERICSESHAMPPDPSLYLLLELGRPAHSKHSKRTLIEEDSDTHVSLRKNVYLQSS
jgi:hypothetical protein